jgi:hypothetical protein
LWVGGVFVGWLMLLYTELVFLLRRRNGALVHLLLGGFVGGCVFGSVFAMGFLLVVAFVQPALSITGLKLGCLTRARSLHSYQCLLLWGDLPPLI